MAFIEIFLLLAVIGYLLFMLGTKNFDYFERRKIPHDKPVPFFGNIFDSIIKKRAFLDLLIEYHMKYKTKFYGFFNMTNAQITIRDPELIKQIFVKDFDHFVNHFSLITPEDDPILGGGLINMKNQTWRDMRATLSPTFTGSKLRFMFEFIKECSQNAVIYVREQIEKKTEEIGTNSSFEIEGKDFFTRYTHNVIASVAFGLKVNSYRDYNNEFFKKSQKAVNFNIWFLIKGMLFTYAKGVAKFFNVKIFDENFNRYFIRLVMDTISFRLKNNIVRPDMIHLLLEARKAAREQRESLDNDNSVQSHVRDWTDEELVAQCFIFFLAGFETSSALMCFTAMELVQNPDIQAQLYDEIHEISVQCKNENRTVTFDEINNMKYLDMVISETLRKWPPAILTDRVCNKRYLLQDGDNEVILQPGDLVWLNIAGSHYDPENFENPKLFDPERFNEDNKLNIKPYTYMPFGIGPRSCIGMRLALLEAKLIIFNLLSNFQLEASEKTILPIELDPKSFQMIPKGGFVFKLKLRS